MALPGRTKRVCWNAQELRLLWCRVQRRISRLRSQGISNWRSFIWHRQVHDEHEDRLRVRLACVKPGVPLVIGGLLIEHPSGLAGHSDGDVLLHAITDALLGAVSAGDIGTFFPPSDPRWKEPPRISFCRPLWKR